MNQNARRTDAAGPPQGKARPLEGQRADGTVWRRMFAALTRSLAPPPRRFTGMLFFRQA